MTKGMLPFKAINTAPGPNEIAFIRRQARARLQSTGALHWPLESLEYGYAWACLEIVLLHSDKASQVYNDIVHAWELPGCHALLDGFKGLPVTQEWIAKQIKAREQGEPLPEIPIEWLDTYFTRAPIYFEGEPHNTDWEYLLKRVWTFILVGFNRQADQDNETWKVIPDTSPLLKSVIFFRSQAEYAKVKLEDLSKYRPAQIDGKLYDLNAIMADKPTAGPERKIYRTLTNTYQKYGFTLKHNSKLLNDAGQWYKCRVNPGSIEAYINSLIDNEITNADRPADQGRISNDIAACDEAVGYPRHS